MSDKKRLMLPNDCQWLMTKSGYPIVYLEAITTVGFDPIFENMFGVRFAAAVAACWWYQEYIRTGRIFIHAGPLKPRSLEERQMSRAQEQWWRWHQLTNATSLNGYEFVPWKEVQ